MPFREQLTSCPKCHLIIQIEGVYIDEKATVRITGQCANDHCSVNHIARDIDTIRVASYEGSLAAANSAATNSLATRSVLVGH